MKRILCILSSFIPIRISKQDRSIFVRRCALIAFSRMTNGLHYMLITKVIIDLQRINFLNEDDKQCENQEVIYSGHL